MPKLSLRKFVAGSALAVLAAPAILIQFGNRRIYARLFHAEIDTPEALRLNRPIAVRPPPADLVDRHARKINEIRVALEIGGANGLDEEPPAPALRALLAGFETAITAGKGVATAAAAAIAALENVPAEA